MRREFGRRYFFTAAAAAVAEACAAPQRPPTPNASEGPRPTPEIYLRDDRKEVRRFPVPLYTIPPGRVLDIRNSSITNGTPNPVKVGDTLNTQLDAFGQPYAGKFKTKITLAQEIPGYPDEPNTTTSNEKDNGQLTIEITLAIPTIRQNVLAKLGLNATDLRIARELDDAITRQVLEGVWKATHITAAMTNEQKRLVQMQAEIHAIDFIENVKNGTEQPIFVTSEKVPKPTRP